MRTVRVLPCETGWQVQTDVIDNVLMFLSGRAAELAAREIADAIAWTGEPATLTISDLRGVRAGQFEFWPEPVRDDLAVSEGRRKSIPPRPVYF